jgi:hypothetical protein
LAARYLAGWNPLGLHLTRRPWRLGYS